jgi:hypothetical protein
MAGVGERNPYTGNRFQPTEDLLDPLADALTDDIARLGRGAAIDATAAPLGDVLGHVWSHLEVTEIVDEVLGVEGA